MMRSNPRHVFQTYQPAHPIQQLLLESYWQPGDLSGLDDTLHWARDHHIEVTVFGTVPEYDAPLARLLAYLIAWNRPTLVAEHRISRDSELDRQIRRSVEDKWHFRFASIYDVLCSGGECKEYADVNCGIPLMDDSHHFNRFGAQLVVQQLISRGELTD
jgi:hypothetical protein